MSEWKEPHPLWIVGHRGAPRRARENTLDSFDFAESEGADAIELDLQQTRDGELVVFHDDTLAIGAARHALRSMASIDVRGLTLDSPFGEYRIPTLDDVFQRYGREMRYILEIKVVPTTNRASAARRVREIVSGFSLTRRCLVASFDADVLRLLREGDGEIALSLLVDKPVVIPPIPFIDAIGPRADLVDDAFAEAAAQAGLSVHPWTVDLPEEIQTLAERGVASITTNDPDLARRVLSA